MRRSLFHIAFLSCLLTLTIGAAPARGAIQLPDLGDESLTAISPTQERRLGEDFVHKARATLSFVDDPGLNAYIQSLGMKLVAHSDDPQLDFRFFIINDPAINAFAVPGGFIFVHTGLILAADTESELAAVLSHEISHITQRHIPRMIADAQRTSLPAMAAILGSILLAASGHQGGEAGMALTTATLAQHSLNFTRSFEEEADRIGMRVLASSGFDPHAMPAFFERMQSLNRYNESDLPEFLRTHPVTTNRIADARARADQYHFRPRPDSTEYLRVRAKIQAMAPGDPNEIARTFEYDLEQGRYRNADAERYGYVWALIRNRQIEEARTESEKLTAHDPRNVSYRIQRAEVEMAAQRYPQALQIYESAYKSHPDDQPLTRYYAAALLKTEHPAPAKGLLKIALRRQPDDANLYRMLAEASGEIGEPIEAHRAMAEFYYQSGNPKAAIEQLRLAARKVHDNFYLQSSLEARIQAIKDEMALYETKN